MTEMKARAKRDTPLDAAGVERVLSLIPLAHKQAGLYAADRAKRRGGRRRAQDYEEALSEAMAALVASSAAYDPSRGTKPITSAYPAVVRAVFCRYEKKAITTAGDGALPFAADKGLGPPEAMEAAARAALARRLADALPASLRAAAEAYEACGMSARAAANRLGIRERELRWRLMMARRLVQAAAVRCGAGAELPELVAGE